ncbi:MAG: hypothetical protein R2751_17170 [Bacteroidales bacterium]
MSIWNLLPEKEALMETAETWTGIPVLPVNNHIHTPHSFSAFSSVEEAVRLARAEGVRILGVNDFNGVDAYGDFERACLREGLFPLFNIELIGIHSADQKAGVRVNDPGNPGRIYISGKGLAHPSRLSGESRAVLDAIVAESNRQVEEMTGKLNRWLRDKGLSIELVREDLLRSGAGKLLRERHVARALRVRMEEVFETDAQWRTGMKTVFGGVEPGSDRDRAAEVENELRSRLLKAGAPAFVPEDERAFLPLDRILSLIREAGGIPTYPLLLDGTGGEPTEFESDPDSLFHALQDRGFRSVEFIPHRNRPEMLRKYAGMFYERGFVVTFGTEHNTSAPGPMTVECKGGIPLEPDMARIGFLGAAALAGHQYLIARGASSTDSVSRNELEDVGRAVLGTFFQTLTRLKTQP